MNRREFSKKSLMFVALSSVLPLISCGESDAIVSLRNILAAVEKAVESLGSLQGLLPQVVQEVRKYLTAVANFVEKVTDILNNATLSDADKASKVMTLASSVVLPNISNTNVAAILLTVHSAFTAFMTLFKSRGNESFSPDDAEKETLFQLEIDAIDAKTTVRDWANDTMGVR